MICLYNIAVCRKYCTFLTKCFLLPLLHFYFVHELRTKWHRVIKVFKLIWAGVISWVKENESAKFLTKLLWSREISTSFGWSTFTLTLCLRETPIKRTQWFLVAVNVPVHSGTITLHTVPSWFFGGSCLALHVFLAKQLVKRGISLLTHWCNQSKQKIQPRTFTRSVSFWVNDDTAELLFHFPDKDKCQSNIVVI